ncbi:hypothetical protein BD410DRAFT_830275 [Rickenella mellea]|uniref:Uncharacterized protein n=1 Tax=Rickenella mellea TaxID=50990 RepID=A0A4Y7PXY6_9AGAM|nr:hypothetical protein BD410DRAFT_830275 [Rickenella mellea]
MLSYLNKIHKDAARRGKKSRKPSLELPSSPESFFCGGDDELSPPASGSSSTPSPNATMAESRNSGDGHSIASKFSPQSNKYKNLPTLPNKQHAIPPTSPGSKPKLTPVKIPPTSLKYKKSLSRKPTRSRSKPGSSSNRGPPSRSPHARSNRRPPTPQKRKSRMTQAPRPDATVSLNSPESPNSEVPSPVSGATLARNIFSEAFDFTESAYSKPMGNTTHNLARNDSTTLPRDRYSDRGGHGRFHQHLSVQTTSVSAAEKRWKLYGHWSRPFVGHEHDSSNVLDSPPHYYNLQDLPHLSPESTAVDLTPESGLRLTDAFSVLDDEEHTPASFTRESIWTHRTDSASSVSPPYSVQQSPRKISPEIVHKSVALRRGYHPSVKKRKPRTLNVINERSTILDTDQESASLQLFDARRYPVQKTAPLMSSSEVTDFIAGPETGYAVHRHSHSLPNITGQAEIDSTVIFDVHIDQDDVVSMTSHPAVRDETTGHQMKRYRVSSVQRFPETPRDVTTFGPEYPPLPPPPTLQSKVHLKSDICIAPPSAVERTDSGAVEETSYDYSRHSRKPSVAESTMSRHPSIDRVVQSRSRPPTPNGPRDRVISRSNSATSTHSTANPRSIGTVHDSMSAPRGQSVSEGISSLEHSSEAKKLQDLKNILRICITEQTERRTELLKSIRAAAGDAAAVLNLSQELNFVISSYDELNEDLTRTDARLLEIKQLQDQESHKALSTALTECVTVNAEVHSSGTRDIQYRGRRFATDDRLRDDYGFVTTTSQIPEVAPLKVNASSKRGTQTTTSPVGLLRENVGNKPTAGLARSPTAGSLLSDVQVILQRDVLNLLGVDELPPRTNVAQSDRSLRPLPLRPTNSAGLFPPDMESLSPVHGRPRSLPDAPGRTQTW